MLTDKPITDWGQVLLPSGQSKLHAALTILRKQIEARQAGDTTPLRVYIDGPTGLGKTTIARLIGRKLPGNVVTEIDGSALSQSYLDTLTGGAFCWRTLIVNEAQNIRESKADLIMNGLDAMGKRACVVFTTMRKGSKAAPLFGGYDVDRAITDRCLEISLTNQGIKSPENVSKVLLMARESGLDFGASERQIENLFEAEGNSIRGVMAAISRGALA